MVSSQSGNNSTINVWTLVTVTCSVPVDLLPNTTITNYNGPVLVGTTAIVNCIGSNKTVVITCMDNGSWEPADPNETAADICLEPSTGKAH